jgi:hypothetical protein
MGLQEVQKYEVMASFHSGISDSCIGDLNLAAALFEL